MTASTSLLPLLLELSLSMAVATARKRGRSTRFRSLLFLCRLNSIDHLSTAQWLYIVNQTASSKASLAGWSYCTR